MAATQAYEEIIDFIAAGSDPHGVSNFRPSEEARQRVAELIAREKSEGLTHADSEDKPLHHRLDARSQVEQTNPNSRSATRQRFRLSSTPTSLSEGCL